jgi:hypothetical protein
MESSERNVNFKQNIMLYKRSDCVEGTQNTEEDLPLLHTPWAEFWQG